MMKMLTFITFEYKTKILFIESYIFLGWARVLKLIPFSRLAPTLGSSMEETNFISKEADKSTLSKVSQTIHIMSRYTFWESQCLVKAIAAMKMLKRRNIESTLYLGTAKDENGELIAHAWLRSGPYYITGSEGMEKFTVVGMFANKGINFKGEGHEKSILSDYNQNT